MGVPLVVGLSANAQSDCRTVCNCAVHLGFGVLVKINERRPRLLCNKDCDNIDGNRSKAAAQLMPSSRKRDWGDRPLFDQSDLYVIPEALIYETFGGILSSTPSSSE